MSLSGGAIAGLAVGSVLLFLVVVYLIIRFRKHKKTSYDTNPTVYAPVYTRPDDLEEHLKHLSSKRDTDPSDFHVFHHGRDYTHDWLQHHLAQDRHQRHSKNT